MSNQPFQCLNEFLSVVYVLVSSPAQSQNRIFPFLYQLLQIPMKLLWSHAGNFTPHSTTWLGLRTKGKTGLPPLYHCPIGLLMNLACHTLPAGNVWTPLTGLVPRRTRLLPPLAPLSLFVECESGNSSSSSTWKIHHYYPGPMQQTCWSTVLWYECRMSRNFLYTIGLLANLAWISVGMRSSGRW